MDLALNNLQRMICHKTKQTINHPKELKMGYCLERVEQYVPAPLRCFKCQKFGHHREACRGRQTCSKCGEKDPDHAEEDCLKEI